MSTPTYMAQLAALNLSMSPPLPQARSSTDGPEPRLPRCRCFWMRTDLTQLLRLRRCRMELPSLRVRCLSPSAL